MKPYPSISESTGRRCYPQGNRKLSRMENGVQVPDDFAHEQCLVITENGKRWLLSGCAHNGILNILDRYKEIFGNEPDYVITGFHMMKKDGEHTEAEKAVIVQTAQELSKMKTVFYSGHCTGIPAFELMKTVMRDKLRALHSGEEVFFGDEPQTYTFSAPICVDSESGGAYVVFPFDIRKEFGKGRVKVHALFDGIPYDGSIVNMGVKDENGNICYVIGVLKSIRTQLGKSPGDTVEVQIRERR